MTPLRGFEPLMRKLGVAAAMSLMAMTATSSPMVSPAPAQQPDAPTLEHPRPDAPADERRPSLPNTGESLSDRLRRSDGVIRPPDEIAPDMRIAPPADPGTGPSMPVIPPPGTPGGRPAPSPK